MSMFYLPFRPTISSNGFPVPSAKMYFYTAGTTTPAAVFSDAALTVTLPHPVVANAAGAWPVIYLRDDILYRVRIEDSNGALLSEADPYLPSIVDQVSQEIRDLVASAMQASFYADRAELYAEIASANTDNVFDSEALALAGLAEGGYGYVSTSDGRFYGVRKVGGVIVQKGEFLTRSSILKNGLNLWDLAKGDGVTNDTAAINATLLLAKNLGVTRVNAGGSGLTYLLGGPFEVLGTFTAPEGIVPFNRHKIRLYSNLHIAGEGAKFKLAGGATYPGGIFGHPWWEGERLENVKITGIVMDGNQDAQIIPPIPAYTWDGSVWQHGNAITGCFDGFEVAHCVFKDLRGHGINFNWASNEPDAWAAPQNLEVHHNEFVNVFTQACNAGFNNTQFHHNRVHGNGFWVGGLDIESGDPRFAIRNIKSYKNVYDFRDGLSPAESTAMYASNSAEAIAGRRHTRRAVTLYCPGDEYTGTMRDVLIEDETIYQGTLALNRFAGVKVVRPFIRNEAEDLPAAYFSSGGNAISIEGFGWSLPDCSVIQPDIESALVGHGIVASTVQRLKIVDGTVRGMPYAAIRLNSCSGSVSNIDAEDFGEDDTGLSSDQIGTLSSAVVIFGGHTSTLQVSNIRATDTRSGGSRRVRHAVYGNVGFSPLTRIEGCTSQNTLGDVIRDVNNSMFAVGNSSSESPLFAVTSDVKFGKTVTVDGGLLDIINTSGGATLGLSSAEGETSAIAMRTGGGIEFILNLGGDGQMNLTTYNDGIAVGNPLAISDTGRLVISGDWEHSIQVVGLGHLWIDEDVNLRIKATAPTSDTDGSIVGPPGV